MTEKTKKAPMRIDATGRWVLVATISASSMAFLATSALNVALPALQADLGATGADLLWIVNGFALLLAALILVGGSLGDQYGRKRVYLIGILLFSLASLVCGVVTSAGALILARLVQGVGGALMVPGSLAIIAATFDDDARGTAIGTWSAATTLVLVLGPVVGGWLAEQGLWRVIFFISLPLAVLAVYALIRYVPESFDEEASRRIDVPGTALITLSLAGITYGAISLGDGATGDNGLALAALIGGIVALLAFVWVESRQAHPLLDLKLFRSRTFSGTNLLTFFLYGALGGALFFLPLNLVQVQSYGATLAGLANLPTTALLILLSPRMGRWVDERGAREPLIIGPVIVAAGFFALSLPGVTAGPAEYWTSFFPGTILLGLGMGLVVAPLTTAVMGAVPRHSAGVASGVNNAVSRSAQVLTVAVMGGLALTLFSSGLMAGVEPLQLSADQSAALMANAADLGGTRLPDAIDPFVAPAVQLAIREAFVQMFRIMMWIAGGLCLFSAVMAAWLVEPRRAEAT